VAVEHPSSEFFLLSDCSPLIDFWPQISFSDRDSFLQFLFSLSVYVLHVFSCVFPFCSLLLCSLPVVSVVVQSFLRHAFASILLSPPSFLSPPFTKSSSFFNYSKPFKSCFSHSYRYLSPLFLLFCSSYIFSFLVVLLHLRPKPFCPSPFFGQLCSPLAMPKVTSLLGIFPPASFGIRCAFFLLNFSFFHSHQNITVSWCVNLPPQTHNLSAHLKFCMLTKPLLHILLVSIMVESPPTFSSPSRLTPIPFLLLCSSMNHPTPHQKSPPPLPRPRPWFSVLTLLPPYRTKARSVCLVLGVLYYSLQMYCVTLLIGWL